MAEFTFGSRTLQDENKVWDFNAWDHVDWDESHIKKAEERIAEQRLHPVSDFDKLAINAAPEKYWDKFYLRNQDNFFKNRKWLTHEFPEVEECLHADAGEKRIMEIGCGVGNSISPLIENNSNPLLHIYGLDFSPRAVNMVRGKFQEVPIGRVSAHLWDVTSENLPPVISPASIDIVLLVFVFSALDPSQWEKALQSLHKMIRPGGYVLFRDYGRYDLAQLRFPKARWLEENFYCRGEGTRVYFFEKTELSDLFAKWFEVDTVGEDRRMLVNRKRRLRMYRCWLQARFLRRQA